MQERIRAFQELADLFNDHGYHLYPAPAPDCPERRLLCRRASPAGSPVGTGPRGRAH